MRYLFLIILSFFFLWSFKSSDIDSLGEKKPIYYNTNNAIWVDSLLTTMTLEEKIGQLFMVAGNGKNLETSYYQKIDSVIKKHGIGGVIFFQSGPQQLKLLLSRYNKLSSIGLLAGIDAEWGVSMRLDSVQKFPWMMTLGAIQDEDLLYQFGTHVAKQFHEFCISASHIARAQSLTRSSRQNRSVPQRF